MSFAEPRIALKPLAMLCRRLALSLSAGVDVRAVWAREALSARGRARWPLSTISDHVARGASVSDAIARTGDFFPELFREMVHVGEETGHLPEVFRQLAENYEQQLRMRRNLLSSLAWPMIELTLALSVVGLVIYLMGAIPALNKSGADLLGFGLRGTSGLVVYLAIVGTVIALVVAFLRASSRGTLWVAPIQHLLMRVPRLGRALETMAMARLAWAMHVTLNTGMDVRPAMKMSLLSTQNVQYSRHVDAVLGAVRSGREIYEALAQTGDFPLEFLEAVRVGEESGQLVESMGHLSTQYQEEARLAMNTLTIVIGFGVFLLIVGIIAFFIFRIAGFYVGILNEATKM